MCSNGIVQDEVDVVRMVGGDGTHVDADLYTGMRCDDGDLILVVELTLSCIMVDMMVVLLADIVYIGVYMDIIIINEGELLRNRTCTNRLVVISASVYILHVVWALLFTDGIIMMHASVIITG